MQVAIKPTPCVAWELEDPAHGSISCASPRDGALECTATCNAGYRFTDGAEEKKFSCADNSAWAPTKVRK